ncbi:MAG TPA: mannosyltransferase family protein [Kineosporiaceae bacterium]
MSYVGVGRDAVPRPRESWAPIARPTVAGRFSRWLVLVAAGYLLIRLAALALIQFVLTEADSTRYSERPSVLGVLRSWDAGWFLTIVEKGYPSAAGHGQPGAVNPDAVVFFPGYPAAIWLVSKITHAPALWVGIAVSAVAGTVAAVLLFVLVDDLYDRRVAVLVVVLWASQPLSIALSMVYSESLFCALTFGALLAMRREHWLGAGVLGFLAGTVRAAGMALGAAMIVYAVCWWWRRRTQEDATPRGVRAVGWSSLAVLGAPVYILMIGWRMGAWTAWFDHQESGWGNRWDWGRTTVDQVVFELSHTRDVYSAVCALSILAALLLLALVIYDRVWLGLAALAVFGVAQAFGGSVMILDKPRYLVPLVALFLPIAVPLSRARPTVQVLVTAGLVFLGLWVSAHSMTVWPYAI